MISLPSQASQGSELSLCSAHERPTKQATGARHVCVGWLSCVTSGRSRAITGGIRLGWLPGVIFRSRYKDSLRALASVEVRKHGRERSPKDPRCRNAAVFIVRLWLDAIFDSLRSLCWVWSGINGVLDYFRCHLHSGYVFTKFLFERNILRSLTAHQFLSSLRI